MPKTKSLTIERLREVLEYDPDSGVFIQKVATGHRSYVGNQVGRPGPGGRTVITIDKKAYYATHLAWLWVKSEWPPSDIRLVYKGEPGPAVRFADIEPTSQAALSASNKINTLNKSGIKGVSWSKTSGRWVAMITRDGRQHYLGKFATKEEAAAAYQHAVETGELRGSGSTKDPNWKTSRRQRSAKWSDIKFYPTIVGWPTVEAFLADMGPPPTVDHVLMRKRPTSDAPPLGPSNAEWRLPWSKQSAAEGKELRRRYALDKFHLEPGEKERKFIEQDGLCAICGRPESMDRSIATDHCHETGLNRGLLCGNCNNGLGRFDDDPARLRAAADYIELWRVTHAAQIVVPMKDAS